MANYLGIGWCSDRRATQHACAVAATRRADDLPHAPACPQTGRRATPANETTPSAYIAVRYIAVRGSRRGLTPRLKRDGWSQS